MNCKELMEYLSRFDPEERVGFIVVDLEPRIRYRIGAYQLIDETPVVLLEVSDSEPLDSILEETEEPI